MNEVRDVARDIAQRTDCRELLRRLVPTWTPIERGNARTLHGACPKCGDRGHMDSRRPVDRFYVSKDGCACNKCHTQRMDAVGLVAWLYDLPMREAVQQLDAGALRAVVMPSQSKSVTSAASDSDLLQPARQKYAQGLVSKAQQLLSSADGASGRQYLLSRGLQPETWQAFRLGYTPDRKLTSDRQRTAPAIVWPIYHERSQAITAVRFRYAGKTSTGDRYDSLQGSATVGRLFGAHMLPEFEGAEWDNVDRLHLEAVRCLVFTEGEVNAMSVWQACHESGIDVLSFCSESQRSLPAWAIDVASRYGAVVVWVDDPAKAQEVGRQLPQAVALRSIEEDGRKWDANALLVAGKLGGLVLAARLSRMTERRESVLWQLWDARDTLDAGQRIVAQRLAQELGKSVSFLS